MLARNFAAVLPFLIASSNIILATPVIVHRTADVRGEVIAVEENVDRTIVDVRSAIGIGMLLYDGIGDTIRVSLSDDPREEVYAGFQILKSLEVRKEGAVLVACPSCGRADVDVIKLANTVDGLLKGIGSPIKVAVMGCEVNGPGEAKDADVGIAAGAGRAIIFRKGQKARIVDESDMLTALMDEIRIVEAEAASK